MLHCKAFSHQPFSIVRDVEIVEVQGDGDAALLVESSVDKEAGNSSETMCEYTARSSAESPESSGTLQVNLPSILSFEDPVKMMDSILNESGTISQNLNLLGK